MWRNTSASLVAILLTTPVFAQAPAPPADRTLAAVPTDAFLFASVRMSKLWDNPAAKPLRDWYASQKPGPLDAIAGLRPEEVERITVFRASWLLDEGGPAVILVMTRRPYNEAVILKSLLGDKPADVPRRPSTGRAFKIGGMFRWVVFVDERTLLYLPQDGDDKPLSPNLLAHFISRKADGPLAAAIAAAQTHDVTVGVDMRGVEAFAELIQAHRNKEVVPFLSLLKARTVTFTADIERTARGQFIMAFADVETARRAAPVLEEAIKFLRTQWSEDRTFREDETARVIVGWGLGVLKSVKVAAVGTNVVASADVPYAEDLAKVVAVLPKDLGKFSSNAHASNNLKQLAIAMHNIHDVYGGLLGDVGSDGKTKSVSWRVMALPFIEQDNLYKMLDHNIPLDDPRNMKVLEGMEMPKIFEHPGRPAPKGHTYFRVFSMPKDAKGVERPFFKEGVRGPKFAEVTDGLSNTLMIVEAEEAVPWYKPDVLAYDGRLPLPQLGAKDADRFLAVMGDGSVQALKPSKLGEKTLRALITINGGEVVEIPK
jgi:hypothetical protein